MPGGPDSGTARSGSPSERRLELAAEKIVDRPGIVSRPLELDEDRRRLHRRQRISIEPPSPDRAGVEPHDAPIGNAIESGLHGGRTRVSLVERRQDEIRAALGEDQPIDAFEDPAAQTLSSVIGGDREDRRVVRVKRPARRSQCALQRQLEPDRRAVTGNGQDTDPPGPCASLRRTVSSKSRRGSSA